MLLGQRILVADRDRAAGAALCERVRAMGGDAIGPIGWGWRALRLVDRERLDGAVLEIELRDGDVTPLALRLVERDVAFVIRSTLPAPAAVKAARLDVPVVAKAAPAGVVLCALAEELRLRQRERREGGQVKTGSGLV